MTGSQPRTVDGRYSFVHHHSSSGIDLPGDGEDRVLFQNSDPWGEDREHDSDYLRYDTNNLTPMTSNTSSRVGHHRQVTPPESLENMLTRPMNADNGWRESIEPGEMEKTDADGSLIIGSDIRGEDGRIVGRSFAHLHNDGTTTMVYRGIDGETRGSAARQGMTVEVSNQYAEVYVSTSDGASWYYDESRIYEYRDDMISVHEVGFADATIRYDDHATHVCLSVPRHEFDTRVLDGRLSHPLHSQSTVHAQMRELTRIAEGLQRQAARLQQ